MSTYYSEIGAQQNVTTSRPTADGDLVAGRVAWAMAKCSTTNSATNLAAGDVLKLVQLPTGAIVVPGLSFIDTADAGTGISIKIGDTDTTAVV